MIDGGVIEGMVFDMDGLLFDSRAYRAAVLGGCRERDRHPAYGKLPYLPYAGDECGRKEEYFLRVIGPDFSQGRVCSEDESDSGDCRRRPSS